MRNTIKLYPFKLNTKGGSYRSTSLEFVHGACLEEWIIISIIEILE